MRKLALFITALVVATLSFAGSSNLTRNSPTLGALAGSWKASQTTSLQPGHDINIVYGGEDMSHRHALIAPIAIA